MHTIRDHRPRHGKTLLAVVVAIICGIVLIALVLPILTTRRNDDYGRLMDEMQTKMIHEAWIVFARNGGERMPTPGRFGGSTEKSELVLLDDDESTLNTTANVHSLCIMQNYYSPELCVSPIEPNARVMVCDDYDWEMYDAAGGVFWDNNFRADLDDVSHVSYASMPLFGRRYAEQWMESYDARFAMIGTRGPKDGIADPSSITYEFFGSRNKWSGTVSFTGGNVAFVDNFTPEQAVYLDAAGNEQSDNIFRFDDGLAGGDAILTFVKEMTADGPVIQHD